MFQYGLLTWKGHCNYSFTDIFPIKQNLLITLFLNFEYMKIIYVYCGLMKCKKEFIAVITLLILQVEIRPEKKNTQAHMGFDPMTLYCRGYGFKSHRGLICFVLFCFFSGLISTYQMSRVITASNDFIQPYSFLFNTDDCFWSTIKGSRNF